MNIVLIMGRKDSKGFPGKNLYKVLVKPLAYYPMKAAKEHHEVDKVYLLTDMGVYIVIPQCFENIENGLLPQRWMGSKIYPLKQCGGLDVDYVWQIPQVEYWVKRNLSKEE